MSASVKLYHLSGLDDWIILHSTLCSHWYVDEHYSPRSFTACRCPIFYRQSLRYSTTIETGRCVWSAWTRTIGCHYISHVPIWVSALHHGFIALWVSVHLVQNLVHIWMSEVVQHTSVKGHECLRVSFAILWDQWSRDLQIVSTLQTLTQRGGYDLPWWVCQDRWILSECSWSTFLLEFDLWQWIKIHLAHSNAHWNDKKCLDSMLIYVKFYTCPFSNRELFHYQGQLYRWFILIHSQNSVWPPWLRPDQSGCQSCWLFCNLVQLFFFPFLPLCLFPTIALLKCPLLIKFTAGTCSNRNHVVSCNVALALHLKIWTVAIFSWRIMDRTTQW